MMIETENLTRKIGSLTFGIDQGEIFGFLGSDDAGKMTILRILTSGELKI
jgi:ABC-type multidrug transport system ATPase subunit